MQAKPIDNPSITEHARVTQAILSNAFLDWTARQHALFRTAPDANGAWTVHHANCVGSFDWQPHMRSAYAKMVAFPIFFDLLDLHVDKRLGRPDIAFAQKLELLQASIDPSRIAELFLVELYAFCRVLRNKIIHHEIAYDADRLVYGASSLPLFKFQIINELIYQFVTFGFEGRSWYQQNVMLSALHHLLDGQGAFAAAARAMEHFVLLADLAQRSRRTLHNRFQYAADDPVLDFVFRHAGSCYDPADPDCAVRAMHPDPQERLVFVGEYYFFPLEGRHYLMPSELVRDNREVRFADLGPWVYPSAPSEVAAA
ncbi:MAG: hypothetical protein LBE53_06540 [Paucimonas sp.]|jgi:hypothetical protein|uniref:hypothetical protein n=1 Tax=Pantoea sp. Cy-639 TaxID=2608360 RepID=UPI00141F31E0|nr:hypothetical protein [Pantoea sp. Cy-639]MDR2306835.1 hypothetical protein [Paucimonas sp.]NIF18442.1 hypothetical protein [Pantoea sp. Cy-639]